MSSISRTWVSSTPAAPQSEWLRLVVVVLPIAYCAQKYSIKIMHHNRDLVFYNILIQKRVILHSISSDVQRGTLSATTSDIQSTCVRAACAEEKHPIVYNRTEEAVNKYIFWLTNHCLLCTRSLFQSHLVCAVLPRRRQNSRQIGVDAISLPAFKWMDRWIDWSRDIL